jgi:hypothetical protein
MAAFSILFLGYYQARYTAWANCCQVSIFDVLLRWICLHKHISGAVLLYNTIKITTFYRNSAFTIIKLNMDDQGDSGPLIGSSGITILSILMFLGEELHSLDFAATTFERVSVPNLRYHTTHTI